MVPGVEMAAERSARDGGASAGCLAARITRTTATTAIASTATASRRAVLRGEWAGILPVYRPVLTEYVLGPIEPLEPIWPPVRCLGPTPERAGCDNF